MLRILTVVVLLPLLAQSVDLDHVVAGSCAVEAPCEESGDGGDCGPGCADCLCCSHRPLLSLAPTRAPAPPSPSRADFLPLVVPAATGDPREILHVPRAGRLVVH